jgi:hypothetical protein
MLGHNRGVALAVGGLALPASRSSTRALGSSESRLPITQPATPAPTTMKSYELDGFDMRFLHKTLFVNSDTGMTIALIRISATLNLLSLEAWMVSGLEPQVLTRRRRCWKPPPTYSGPAA